MKLPCPNCHTIGRGIYRIKPASLLWGALMIGTGLVSINSTLFGSHILSIFISILLLILGCYYVLGYFFGSKNCPICNEDRLTNSTELPADNAIKKDKHIDKGYICVDCYNASPSSHKKQNKYGSTLLMLAGLNGIISLFFNDTNSFTIFFDWLGYLLFLGVGSYGIYTNFTFNNICLRCGNKNSMIPLDTPKAQALIKEHNLAIPEEAQQQASIPKTSQ